MAASGRKKKSSKGKTLNLTEFLASSGGGGSPAPAPVSWADETEDIGDEDDLANVKYIDRSRLPTAPRAACGPAIDPSTLPDSPPFTAFMGNLPFDIDEEDISRFFQQLNVVGVRLPQESGRQRGYGYAEFEDKASLIEALGMNDELLRNRKIRVDVAGNNQGGDDRGGRRREDDGDDRTQGDWRKTPRAPDNDRSFDRRDDRYGDKDRDRGFGGRDRFGDRDRMGGDRDRYGGDRDRYGGDRDRYGGDRDRDGGRRSFGTGYGRSGDGGGRSGGYGDRRGYSPPRDRYGGGGGSSDRDRYARRDDDPPKDRPRLQLQPRSKPAEESHGGGGSGRIFGDATPVNTTQHEEKTREERLKDATIHSSTPSGGGGSTERPKLNLQKRSKPIETDGNKTSRTASIFGNAKPVDTATKERAIEERLQRERDQQNEMEAREKRLSSSRSGGRRDSNTSVEDQPQRRQRKLSSSSSGKGIRTVAPPPGAGSARIRSDSVLSDPEDVFEDDTRSAVSSEDSPKMVPAPPPKENVWEMRKGTRPPQQAPAQQVNKDESRARVPPPKQEDNKTRNKENVVPAAPAAENAWKKGKPDLSSDSVNVWDRRKAEQKKDPEPQNENAWAKGSPPTDAASGRGRGGSRGRGVTRETSKEKDFVDTNKFGMLEEDAAVSD